MAMSAAVMKAAIETNLINEGARGEDRGNLAEAVSNGVVTYLTTTATITTSDAGTVSGTGSGTGTGVFGLSAPRVSSKIQSIWTEETTGEIPGGTHDGTTEFTSTIQSTLNTARSAFGFDGTTAMRVTVSGSKAVYEVMAGPADFSSVQVGDELIVSASSPLSSQNEGTFIVTRVQTSPERITVRANGNIAEGVFPVYITGWNDTLMTARLADRTVTFTHSGGTAPTFRSLVDVGDTVKFNSANFSTELNAAYEILEITSNSIKVEDTGLAYPEVATLGLKESMKFFGPIGTNARPLSRAISDGIVNHIKTFGGWATTHSPVYVGTGTVTISGLTKAGMSSAIETQMKLKGARGSNLKVFCDGIAEALVDDLQNFGNGVVTITGSGSGSGVGTGSGSGSMV